MEEGLVLNVNCTIGRRNYILYALYTREEGRCTICMYCVQGRGDYELYVLILHVQPSCIYFIMFFIHALCIRKEGLFTICTMY